jgi:hypothetical protein
MTIEEISIPLSRLELRWADRRVEEMQTPRRFLDFIVDGKSLHERLGCPDAVTLLGWLRPPQHLEVVDQLLLLTPSELAEGRRELYVCPECGDVGCGAVTAVVLQQDEKVLWADFAHYVPWSDTGDPQIVREDYEAIGPFAFDAEAYAATLRSGLRMANEQVQSEDKFG